MIHAYGRSGVDNMPLEDLSPGEVARTIHRIERTLDKIDAKFDGLDNKVDSVREQLVSLAHDTAANTRDIAKHDATRKADAAKQENRRWMIYLALVAAGLAFLSQFYFAARGGS